MGRRDMLRGPWAGVAAGLAAGVLETLAAEQFDLVLIEKARGAPRNGAAGQIQALFEKAGATVMLVRPAPRPA